MVDNYASNSITDRKLGNWQFYLYHPEGATQNTYKGKLEITKEFHTVMDVKTGNYIASIPNPNIAYVENKDLLEK